MTDDLPLFNQPPSQRVDTSEAAAESMVPVAPTLRRRVLAYITAQGWEGATQDECAEALNLKTQTAVARVWELERAGLIYKTDRKRQTRSGRDARVYLCPVASVDRAGAA